MTSPKVSIIVPCFKVEKYLDRCMQSLLNQILKDIEIILVDDGSPDNCSRMCDEYAKKDSRIKVIHKQNAGLGYARNSGIDVALGEYIAFVDSDDHVSTLMYESLYRKAKESHADAVFGGIYIESNNGTWNELHEFDNNRTIKNDEVISFMLNMVACKPKIKSERLYEMSVWRAIYKRDIISQYNIRFLSERDIVSEDIPFNIDFLKHAKVVSFIDKGFYYYHLNGTSLTSNVNPQKFEGYKNLHCILINKLGGIDKDNERANRFFIGYCRMFLLQLANSTIEHKIAIINNLVQDPIWDKIAKQYSYNDLPFYPKVIYILILKKNTTLLFLFSWFFMILKKIRGKRL